MVRNYKRKRIEPAPGENNYANAIQAVAGGMGLRKAAAVYGVKHNTLFYRIKTESKVAAEERGETVANRLEYSGIYFTLFYRIKTESKVAAEERGETVANRLEYSGIYFTSQVFTTTEEELLVKYILKSSTINYGLTRYQSRYAVALNDWIISNPGKAATIHDLAMIVNVAYQSTFTIKNKAATIHDLAMIVNVAYQSTFTIKNIIEGFRKTGIWPLNKLIFSDNDYDCAFVTDQSEVTELQTEKRTP
ncbi:CENP-B N-terminal DNA-binding domain [Popillia japonica]|uniref:CENP-B N-terminal DNA-binding domain n=1 Tax=Popillia japonica TaxID=7064 RepID=A0AAW1K4V5_POPJA